MLLGVVRRVAGPACFMSQLLMKSRSLPLLSSDLITAMFRVHSMEDS